MVTQRKVAHVRTNPFMPPVFDRTSRPPWASELAVLFAVYIVVVAIIRGIGTVIGLVGIVGLAAGIVRLAASIPDLDRALTLHNPLSPSRAR